MAIISVEFAGDNRFKSQIRKHKIDIDLTPDLKGTDTGPMPPELVVLGLASCMGYYILFYCRRNNISAEGLKIEAEFEKAKNPDRISKINVRFHLPGITEQHKNGVIKAAEGCLVHQTFIHKPEINIALY